MTSTASAILCEVHEPKTEKPLSEELKTEEPPSKKPKMEETLSEEPKTEEPPSKKLKMEEPLSEEPLSEEPPSKKPKMEETLFASASSGNDEGADVPDNSDVSGEIP
ncbi:anthocyanidin reductase-like protein, partial [Aphelenchoides avenae]